MTAPDRGDREQQQHHRMAGPDAGDEQDRTGAHADHRGRTEVVLHEDEADGQRRDQHRDGEPPGVEIAAVLVAVTRDRDDHRDLRDLARLELQRSDVEPRLRALAGRADHQHTDEQREHREVAEHPQVAQAPVVDDDAQHHRDDAEPDRERLPLHEVRRVDALALEPGARRRVDHQEAQAR